MSWWLNLYRNFKAKIYLCNNFFMICGKRKWYILFKKCDIVYFHIFEVSIQNFKIVLFVTTSVTPLTKEAAYLNIFFRLKVNYKVSKKYLKGIGAKLNCAYSISQLINFIWNLWFTMAIIFSILYNVLPALQVRVFPLVWGIVTVLLNQLVIWRNIAHSSN